MFDSTVVCIKNAGREGTDKVILLLSIKVTEAIVGLSATFS
jgi:hypothetical protein